MKNPLTFLCISGEFKGLDFLRYCKEAGNRIFLVTSHNLKDKPWPMQYIDEIFYMEETAPQVWSMDDLVLGLSHLMRHNKVDTIVALDDFDVEKAAHLREHFRIPGMGETTCRHFRDKLAMRMKAKEGGVNVPAFAALFNDAEVNAFAEAVLAPWVVKPRGEASATGIKKVHSKEELWQVIHDLGDERHNYLVEQFKPGDVYHVDALSYDGKVVFSRVSRYLSTPFEVAHGGGIFRSVIVEYGSEDDKALQQFNKEVLKTFGLKNSASHTEYIKANADGKFYFLETASRVGGAHLAEMVEASSGINLWGEWAKLEDAAIRGVAYKVPKARKDYAGIVVSLAKFQDVDDSGFQDAEIVWRLRKDYHIGLIVQAQKQERVLELLDDYAQRINRDFHAAG